MARIPMVFRSFFPNFLPFGRKSLAQKKVSHEARPAEPGFEQGGEIFPNVSKTATKKKPHKGFERTR